MSAQTFITCPACGFVDKEFSDYPDDLRGDGDEAEWQCGMCDAICVVEMQVSYAFDTKPKPAPATPPEATAPATAVRAFAWRSEAPFDNGSWPKWAPWRIEYEDGAGRYRVMCGMSTVAVVGPTLVAHWLVRANNEAQERNRAAEEAARASPPATAKGEEPSHGA